MIESATGLVFRTRPLTETSLIVHWLTPRFGRLGTVAKGARRVKSPFHGKLDLFYLADFSFSRSLRSELHTLREVILRETHSRLRANPDEIRFWRDYFTQATDIKPTPDLMGDPQLELGHCVLETELGTTHISFETQLKEIEQGFLDLLEHRPRVRE